MAKNRKPNPAAVIDDDAPPEPTTAHIDGKDDQGERLPLQATPNRKRLEQTRGEAPTVGHLTYAVVSTGQKGKIDIIPLHEVPLLRKKIKLQEPASDGVKVLAEFPERVDRFKAITAAGVRSEYNRLLDRYRFDTPNGREGDQTNLVADLYGTNLSSLLSAIRRIERGMRQVESELGADEAISDEQMDEIAGLADPDYALQSEDGVGDIVYQPFEPAGMGAVIPSEAEV